MFTKLLQSHGSSSTYSVFLRMGIGALLLVTITLVKEGPKAFKVSRNTLISCILLGLICQAVYNVFYMSAINTIGMALSSVLLYTAPIFTGIFSVLFFKEKMGKKKVIALLINIIGCVLTVTGGRFEGLSFGVTGLFFGVMAGFCYSLTAIFGRLASSENESPFVISTYNFLFATLFVAVFLHPWTTVEEPLKPVLLLIGLGFAIVPTALSYLVYFPAVGNITESSRVPVIASVETVVALLIGILAFHEDFRLGSVIGVLFVFASIVIMNLEFTPKRKGKNE